MEALVAYKTPFSPKSTFSVLDFWMHAVAEDDNWIGSDAYAG